MKTETDTIEKVSAEPIKTPWGTLTAGFDDTANGEKITCGSMTMGSNAGTCEVKHGGKKHKVTIIQNFGASLSLSANGRYFHLDLEALVDHAINAGLLDPSPKNFPRATPK